jgi:uncharacterized protein YggE
VALLPRNGEEEESIKAIKEACEDARAKADAIARGSGLEFVRVSAVRECGVYVEPYREVGFEYPTPKASAPPIEPKGVKVRATINVVYECR